MLLKTDLRDGAARTVRLCLHPCLYGVERKHCDMLHDTGSRSGGHVLQVRSLRLTFGVGSGAGARLGPPLVKFLVLSRVRHPSELSVSAGLQAANATVHVR